MQKKFDIKESIRMLMRGLPLAGILVGSFVPMPIFGRQLLILILLLWFNVFFVMDIFNGQ